MNRKNLLACLAMFCFSLTSFAGTVIRTKDGKVFQIPVESSDIASIEFSRQAVPPKVAPPAPPIPPKGPPAAPAAPPKIPPNAPTGSVGKTPFDGLWHTKRQHTDGCGFQGSQDMVLSTDGNGVTSSSSSSVFANARGKVTGTKLSTGYGFVNNVAKAHADYVLGADGKSFSGTFSDSGGHRGTINGWR